MTRLDEVPVGKKLIPVEVEPFQHKAKRPFREISVYDSILDVQRDPIFAVHGMKMRRRVFSREYADHYPQESGDLRHAIMVPTYDRCRQYRI
jgi:hypothetical protein